MSIARSMAGGGNRESLVSPILNRRRAEARLREATVAHEASMAQMRSAVVGLDRRMHKQQCWMQQSDKQILAAEIEKVRVRVRLDKAEQRAKSLSKDLSSAYDNVVSLLEDRLRLQDTKARNEALVAYLNVIGKSNQNNEAAFFTNKSELCTLLKLAGEKEVLECRFEAMSEESTQLERFVDEIMTKCEDVLQLNVGFQGDWVKVPAVLKESKFSGMARTKSSDDSMHPVAAVQQIGEAISTTLEEFRRLSEGLAKVLAKDAPTSEAHLLAQQHAAWARSFSQGGRSARRKSA